MSTTLPRVGREAARRGAHNRRVFCATAHIGIDHAGSGFVPDYEAVEAFRRKCAPSVLRRLPKMVRPYFPTMRQP